MVPNCVYSLHLDWLGVDEFLCPAWRAGMTLSSLVTWAASIITSVPAHDQSFAILDLQFLC
jgi:hypothetical protein